MRSIAVVVALVASSAGAQGLSGTDGPAELPPSDFSGAQYVDSRGCLFVRAGLDGSVLWVPRVDRSRQLLCGFEPTFSQADPPAAPPVVKAAAPVRRTAAVVSVPMTSTKLPKGFKAAWTDGRLNPHRGPRTELGNAQMAQKWTKTVPARLIK